MDYNGQNIFFFSADTFSPQLSSPQASKLGHAVGPRRLAFNKSLWWFLPAVVVGWFKEYGTLVQKVKTKNKLAAREWFPNGVRRSSVVSASGCCTASPGSISTRHPPSPQQDELITQLQEFIIPSSG